MLQIPVGNQLATPAATFTASSVSPATFASTPIVDTIASFAVNPEIEAATRLPFAKAKRCKDRSDHTTDGCHKAVCTVFYHSKSTICESESAKEPHYYTGKEQDRTGFDDEAFQSFPYMKKNCLNLRNMILWKLHNERSRFTGERFCFL